MAYCTRCRRAVPDECYNFWQGTAWCGSCRDVVNGTLCKVPFWVLALVVYLSVRVGLPA